jgi:hypothetical protein
MAMVTKKLVPVSAIKSKFKVMWYKLSIKSTMGDTAGISPSLYSKMPFQNERRGRRDE